MTVNFVFDTLDPESTSLVSNLTGSYYNKDDWNEIPYWYEWGNNVNRQLFRDYAWDKSIIENSVIKCELTSEHWDLHHRVEVIKDIPYLITVDIKLGTASNCNISILDSEVWTFLGGRSFNLNTSNLSTSEWTSVSLEMLPSQSGAIHLHVGAIASKRLAVQDEGTVFIKNLRVKSETTDVLITSFSNLNGRYEIINSTTQTISCILLSEISKYDNDFNVYPIVITTAEHFYCWPLLLLSRNIVNLVNENKLKILFLCNFEPIRESFLTIHHQIARICSFTNIKKIDNIIFTASDSTIKQRVLDYKEEILKTDNTADLIKFKDVNGYGYVTHKILKDLNKLDWLEIYCSKIDKPHLFLYLNHRVTYHRFLLYKQIEYKNLLDHGIHSWHGYNQAHQLDYNPIHDFYYQVKTTSTFNEEEQKFIDYVRSNPTIEIAKIKDDSAYLLADPLVEGSRINPNWISNTYFSIVTETHVGHLPSHVTEKIYKLMFYCHPFIVLGPTNHLATLHRYGFKTFPEMFDESYDTMPETFEKYNFISDQIKFYTTDEGREKLKQLRPTLKSILEYNRNHLLSLSSDDVWNSLEKLYEKN